MVNNKYSCLVVWNHEILNDFPETVGNGIIIPTDELIFFKGVETTNQLYNLM
jgi:hypothetical protein